MRLLISGVPGTGKSTFSRWLADQHGYYRLPDGDEPGAGFLDEAFRLLKARDDVVIDWGFPVSHIGTVRQLIASGASGWWFDGDRTAALTSFMARGTVPKAAWDLQLAAIETSWSDLAQLFDGRILHVVSGDPPVHVPAAEILEQILERTASLSGWPVQGRECPPLGNST